MESDENNESGRNGQKAAGNGHNGETRVDSEVMINPFYAHFHRKKDKWRILNTMPHAKNRGRFKSDREKANLLTNQQGFVNEWVTLSVELLR